MGHLTHDATQFRIGTDVSLKTRDQEHTLPCYEHSVVQGCQRNYFFNCRRGNCQNDFQRDYSSDASRDASEVGLVA